MDRKKAEAQKMEEAQKKGWPKRINGCWAWPMNPTKN